MPFTTFLKRIQGKEELQEEIIMPVFEDVSEEVLKEEDEVFEENKPEILSEEELLTLSKTELDEYAFGYGIELDRRKSKSSMINDFITQLNKGE